MNHVQLDDYLVVKIDEIKKVTPSGVIGENHSRIFMVDDSIYYVEKSVTEVYRLMREASNST